MVVAVEEEAGVEGGETIPVRSLYKAARVIEV